MHIEVNMQDAKVHNSRFHHHHLVCIIHFSSGQTCTYLPTLTLIMKANRHKNVDRSQLSIWHRPSGIECLLRNTYQCDQIMKLKGAQNFPLVAQKLATTVFTLTGMFSKIAQKVNLYLGYFRVKYVTKNFKKTPNLVSLSHNTNLLTSLPRQG